MLQQTIYFFLFFLLIIFLLFILQIKLLFDISNNLDYLNNYDKNINSNLYIGQVTYGIFDSTTTDHSEGIRKVSPFYKFINLHNSTVKGIFNISERRSLLTNDKLFFEKERIRLLIKYSNYIFYPLIKNFIF